MGIEPFNLVRPLTLVALLLIGVTTSNGAAAAASGDERAIKPKVVCKKSVSGDRFLLKRKPDKCLFHQRGAPSWAGLQAIAVAQDLSWSSWGPKTAVAKGKIFISSVGPVPARFLLKTPRRACGSLVFTRVKVTNLGLSSSSTWPLTSCVK